MLGKSHPLKLPRKILSYRCPHQGRTAFWLTKIAELWPIPGERRQICHMVCNGVHQQQILDSKFGGQKIIFMKMEDPWHCWYSSWAPTREANDCLQWENVVPVFHWLFFLILTLLCSLFSKIKKMFSCFPWGEKPSFAGIAGWSCPRVRFSSKRIATQRQFVFLIQQRQRDRSSSKLCSTTFRVFTRWGRT